MGEKGGKEDNAVPLAVRVWWNNLSRGAARPGQSTGDVAGGLPRQPPHTSVCVTESGPGHGAGGTIRVTPHPFRSRLLRAFLSTPLRFCGWLPAVFSPACSSSVAPTSLPPQILLTTHHPRLPRSVPSRLLLPPSHPSASPLPHGRRPTPPPGTAAPHRRWGPPPSPIAGPPLPASVRRRAGNQTTDPGAKEEASCSWRLGSPALSRSPGPPEGNVGPAPPEISLEASPSGRPATRHGGG